MLEMLWDNWIAKLTVQYIGNQILKIGQYEIELQQNLLRTTFYWATPYTHTYTHTHIYSSSRHNMMNDLHWFCQSDYWDRLLSSTVFFSFQLFLNLVPVVLRDLVIFGLSLPSIYSWTTPMFLNLNCLHLSSNCSLLSFRLRLKYFYFYAINKLAACPFVFRV